MCIKIVLLKYPLPNGNVFIWRGTGGIWGKSEGVDNVLVLVGGDVLFLKTLKELSLWKEEVKKDIVSLSYQDFATKYELPIDGDLWSELKEGVEMRKYPPITQPSEQRVAEFKRMVSVFLGGILQLKNPDERISWLEEIIHECQEKILQIKSGSS